MDTKTRNEMGTTTDGRLHGAPAVDLLLDEMAKQDSPNTWTRAQAVVDAADPEVVNAALWDLLALTRFDRDATEPQVAMRNVRERDIVRLHGCKCFIRKVRDAAEDRSEKRTITLTVELHGEGGIERTFAYSANVRIPLLAREVA